ncbi:MAG TPA: hypothetical protein VMR31_04105 [Myxococcota bacterium]|jgi:hypothetical protein|nr:hypothetical protein [Myxococcota bacterium]
MRMTQVTHRLAQLRSLEAAHPETLTLLDLVAAVADASSSEEEVVAVVHDLIESGRVTLVGNFRSRDVGHSS